MAVMTRERIMGLLQAPRITEKSTRLGDAHKQFVFKVVKNATKPEIKKAVEMMFDVKVETVRTVNVMGKTKAYRQSGGRRSDWKKAYVKLKPGFDIDYMNVKGS
jgi:large subunit ribosomal protein L23